MYKKLVLTLLLIVVLITLLGGCTARASEKSGLKIGSLPRIIDLVAYVAQQEGLFDKQGVAVQIVPFRSTLEMNSALLAGELDGIIQDIFEAVNFNKEKTIAKLVGRGVMPGMFFILASPASNITSAKDLKGKEIAVATGTIIDYALDRLLAAEGLDHRDTVKVNIPSMPSRLEILNQGKISAAIFAPPLSDMALINGARAILDDIKQPFAGPGLIFSTKALTDKSQAVNQCVQAWQEAVKLVNAEPEKYRALLTEVASIPEPIRTRVGVPTFARLRLPTDAEIDEGQRTDE